MKTRNTPSILITLLLAFLTLGAMQAQAIVINWRPVGITFGQTARVTEVNIGTSAITLSGTFLDSEGAILGQFDRQVIEPGKMMSFDLNADDIVQEGERIEIRVVISRGSSAVLRTSIEVFENATGKTTILYGDPNQ
jgi:hypothetical protein